MRNDVWKKIALYLLGLVSGCGITVLALHGELSDLRTEVAEIKGIVRATIPAVFTTGPTFVVTAGADSVTIGR